MDHTAIEELLRQQAGVISRSQVLRHGGREHDIERMLRRREWATVRPGAYVDHTASPTWRQRAWAAVLVHQPAVLAGRSALRLYGLAATRAPGPGEGPEGEAVELLVAQGRRLTARSGERISRSSRFDRLALLHLHPPRVRVEHAVLCVASRTTQEDEAVAVVGRACQSRRTTPQRLFQELELSGRLRRRALLREVLTDVGKGAHSALERRYLRDVERAHGLPTGRRQERVVADGTVAYRDVDYREFGTVVELDGRTWHDDVVARWHDLERDVRSLVGGDVTLRAGWRQVIDRCRLARAVALVLMARGWTGRPHPCSATCRVNAAA